MKTFVPSFAAPSPFSTLQHPSFAATLVCRPAPKRAGRRRRVKLAVAVVRPDEGTTCMRAVVAADEALRVAVGRTLAQRVVDFFAGR